MLQSKPEFLPVGLNRERLKFWGIRSGVSVLDQGLTSGAGLILNLFLARWLQAEAYGAFAVAFATLIFVSGFHSVLLLEPMSVFGPAGYAASIIGYFRAQLKVHILLVAVLSLLLLLAALAMSALGIHRELVSATAASAIAFPLVLLLWLVRRMCYVSHCPAIAAWASAGYLLALVCGLFLMHGFGKVGPAGAMLLMAGASVVAIPLPLHKLGMLSTPPNEASCVWKAVWRENWNYGRWLVASTTLFSLASQTQTYLAAAILGLGAAGALRALQVPSLVMIQVVSAIGLLLLPTMAREYGLGHMRELRKKAIFASTALAALALAYAAFLAIFAGPIENLMYAGKFSSSARLIPVLALVPVFTAFANGFSMALKAAQKPQFDLLANAIAAPVGLVTAILFIKFWGLGGAGMSLVAGFATYAAVFLWSFKRQFAHIDTVGEMGAD